MIGITNAGGGNGVWQVATVYGGVSTPANPKEYDIFINTSTPLLGGEITPNVLSKPTWVAIDGIWYIGLTQGGIAGDYCPLVHNKRNGHNFTGSPTQAWERINGQWWPMNAYMWHNSQWVQFSWSWDGELFYQGNQYTEHTGGWTGMVRNASVSPSVSDPANPNLFSDANAVAGGTAWFRTVNKVDMTNYKTLKWTGWGFGENSGGKYGAHCTVHDNPSTDSGIISDVSFQNEGTYSMDISGISGAHYITFRAMGSGAQRVSISKVWME